MESIVFQCLDETTEKSTVVIVYEQSPFQPLVNIHLISNFIIIR